MKSTKTMLTALNDMSMDADERLLILSIGDALKDDPGGCVIMLEDLQGIFVGYDDMSIICEEFKWMADNKEMV